MRNSIQKRAFEVGPGYRAKQDLRGGAHDGDIVHAGLRNKDRQVRVGRRLFENARKNLFAQPLAELQLPPCGIAPRHKVRK